MPVGRFVLALLLALLLPAVAADARTCAGATTVPSASTIAQGRKATLCLLNEQRRARHLPPLRGDRALERAATGFSKQMVRLRFFDHIGPDGTTPDQRIEAAGYGAYRLLAENIAWGSHKQATPAHIVAEWMRSPGHRRNILDGKLRDIGIGIVPSAPQDGGDRAAATYTTDFGRHR